MEQLAAHDGDDMFGDADRVRSQRGSSLPSCIHTLTVNSSHDSRQGVTGIGIVIQERRGVGRRGPIVAQISEVRHDASSGSAEALAILRAFEIAIEQGYSHVQVRSDANSMRKQLRRLHSDGAPGPDPIRAKILELARRLVSVRFAYVARRKNHLARQLARTARLADPVYSMSTATGRGPVVDVLHEERDEPLVDEVLDIDDDEDLDEIPF